MTLSKKLYFFSDPSFLTALEITLLLMLIGFIYYYFYSMPSSNLCAPKKENSSSNSSEPKTMESTSTSSIQKNFKYDVFISFRGEDTRKNFVDHLYHALKDKGIYTYKDDEKIQKGKRISDDLFKSIEESKIYIIIFSKNYASSSWCLEELVKIMECHKMNGHIAYPVFYDVKPTDIRQQTGVVGEAFAKHENEDAAGKWRDALKEAAEFAGRDLENTFDGHEAKFIRKVVQEISLELRPINLGFDEKLVGMESRVKDVVSSLKLGDDEVHIIGIKGMGGAGKTTTARVVYDHLSYEFEAISFVENVREVSTTTLGLKKLQEQVLSKVLNEPVTLDSVKDGKIMMQSRMCGKKVLLVLDDVDHIEQLKALAGETKWFKPGSRILITTRDEQVLVAHRVNLIRDVVLLSKQEAISLFSRYAFGTENPLQGYEELAGKVVGYADGLPLTVEVLGSFLCGKDKLEWVDAIERLEKIPLKETMEKLELSYTSLEHEYKEIFLDIACLLKGETKENAIRILECCGFYARNGIKVLEQRSLITISSKYGQQSVLGMHDHLEEMGKNIVRRLHPDEPSKHSRLWNDAEIKDILANDQGTEATKCMELTTLRRNSRIVMKGLVKMKKLRYLKVNFAYYDVFLSFGGEDTCKNFANHLYQALLDRGIYTYKDDEKIHKGERISDVKAIEESKFYIIVFSKNYASSSWCLDELLKIMECHKMTGHTALPIFYDVKPTEVRKQSGAVGEAFAKHEKEEAAEKWRGTLKEAANLTGWELKNTLDHGYEDKFIRKIVEELLLELRHITGGDGKLIRMGTQATRNAIYDNWEIDSGCLPSDPNFDDTSQLDEATQYFPNSLEYLKCTNYPFLYLPKTFQANNLVGLDMKYTADYNSSRIEQLWEEGEKKVLEKLKFLSLFNIKLTTFDLGLTPNLETLSLFYCTHFVKLQVSAPCPNLKILNLSCSRLRSLDLELIPNLESLDLTYSKELVEINPPVGCLQKVVKLNLNGCALFEKLAEDLGGSGCLKELHITNTSIRHLPQSIFGLKGLKIDASRKLLQLYDFPSEITTTSDPDWGRHIFEDSLPI